MFRSPKDVSVKNVETEMGSSNNEIEQYYCDICDQGPWSTETDIEIHRLSVHRWYLSKLVKDRSNHTCSLCVREQNDRQSLIEHILVHHLCCTPDATRIDRPIFICDHCQHLFFNKQLLIIHIYYYHTKKDKNDNITMINCPKCWKSITRKSIWFHLFNHGCFNIGTCPICLKICKNIEEMIEHIKTHPYYLHCDICGYETSKQYYLNKHMETHKKKIVENTTKTELSRFFLPKRFVPSLKNRMTHVLQGIPLSNAVYLCVMCRALCFMNDGLKQVRQHILGDHMPEEHAKSKTYMCVCGEEFFNGVLLKHHIFKMKGSGHHEAWDGVSPIIPKLPSDTEMVYEVYQITTPDPTDVNQIFISGRSITEAYGD